MINEDQIKEIIKMRMKKNNRDIESLLSKNKSQVINLIKIKHKLSPNFNLKKAIADIDRTFSILLSNLTDLSK